MIEVTRLAPDTVDLAEAVLERVYHRVPGSRERLASLLADPGFVLLAASKNNEPVAYLHASLMGRLDGRLMMLIYEVSVTGDERRKGIGRSLLSSALSIAQGAGATRCWLLTESDNAAAIGLYESMGGEAFPTVGYSWTLGRQG